MASHAPANESHDHTDAHHPSDSMYIRIAVILTAITGIEVLIYYIDALSDILVPALIVFSAAKFVLVVGFFMHLKFDDKRLTWIFVSGLAVAFAVLVVVFALIHWHGITEFAPFQPPAR